jgi:hypothetical protein
MPSRSSSGGRDARPVYRRPACVLRLRLVALGDACLQPCVDFVFDPRDSARPQTYRCGKSAFRGIDAKHICKINKLRLSWRRECPPRHAPLLNNFNHLNPRRSGRPHLRPHRMHVLAAAKNLTTPYTGERQPPSAAKAVPPRHRACPSTFPAKCDRFVCASCQSHQIQNIQSQGSSSEPNYVISVVLPSSQNFLSEKGPSDRADVLTVAERRRLGRPPALWANCLEFRSFLGT